MHVEIKPIGKWSALLGMTGIAGWTALQAYALNVGGAVGVAFFLSTNAVTLAILGALTYTFFKTKKLLPKWLKNIFPKFSKKQDPLKAAQDKILSKRDEHIISLPEGTTKAGDPTGIAQTKLGKEFF